MFWINPNINKIINSSIIEYDIKSGNTSIMKVYNLYPDDKIKDIEKLNKKDRVIKIGKIMKEDKNFSKLLEKGFNDIIYEFIKENNLDIDNDIISIKRDAVFVINKPIIKNTIKKYCYFDRKNEYDGYFKIPKYEFYINSYENKIDVKGLNDSNIILHQNGIIECILNIYKECIPVYSPIKFNKYMKELITTYKNRELPYEYYKEFNEISKYNVIIEPKKILMTSMSETFINRCDISYNFINILIPLLNLLC